ncbi:MAG TPA: Ig-like domain-containing protein [Thermoanaerobaculia bacterium]|nr:Ig-like domain-containing protein [Thermoanaerobaculia bacterium]
MKQAVALLALLCLLAPALGCDKASPVAPAGSILSLSANPTKIGLNGSSTITVVGRKPDGNPLNPGTEIRLSSDLGTLSPSIVEVDSGGRATATLRGDGRSGPAKITAATADATVDTTIQIGDTDTTRPTALVSVTPSTVALGGTAEVTVIARNADGSPVAPGGRVTLTTTLGSLVNDRPQIQGNGVATTTLNAGDREGTATITAIVGSSAPATTTATIVLDAATAISVTANPASIQSTATTEIRITATVTNSRAQSVSGALVIFESDIGSFTTTTSETTNASGEATKTLRVAPGDIPAAPFESFRVRVRTPSSSGSTFIEGSTQITINRPSGT